MISVNLLQNLPLVAFGTSNLGNLYEALSASEKQEVVKEYLQQAKGCAMFDTAGKYGAGLALESLGNSLRALGVKPDEVVISNKLGWYRTELKGPEPTFEPGVWKQLQHDAEQRISYEGILACYHQGNELLGGYLPQLVSVHDPDEYLATAKDAADAERLYEHILEGYRALRDLKEQGKVQAIGVGAKNWKVIQRIASDVELDWVMLANSMTVWSHPRELVAFMEDLERKNVKIINSAVFQGGFLIGGDYYNYKLVKPDMEEYKYLIKWREKFFALCQAFDVTPARVCVQFSLNAPGVTSVALSTSEPRRVRENTANAETLLPTEFWKEMRNRGLIRSDYNYLG